MARCPYCERVSLELERAHAAGVDLGVPDDLEEHCRCLWLPRVHDAATESAIVDRAAASMRAEHDAMPRAIGACGHVVTVYLGAGYCAECGGRYAPRAVEIVGPLPRLALAEAA